jgi:uncharacterized circularly permuted ATP-grasp superfamily protein/uncharacterized alpha-E superfamily protein
LPRKHWRQLAVAIRHMGLDQLRRRWELGRQIIQTNGVTYNVYGDPRGAQRPWLLDPIPLVIDGSEWTHIESSIQQRATLLNAILADLYGPQRLIHERHLPAALLFSSPHFLRPCVGIAPAGAHIHTYAADLARSPDGNWWVIADRTQSPSGIGYALENRLVSARTLPAIFNQCRVRPLTGFLERQRIALFQLAAHRTANPRVVILTPGPHNETYFEHSFLARHWGFPLVEGADLTVRDNKVFLKTLAGLEPVDVILRRMDDSFCDPLELRGDSLLGVPGLTHAVRSGNVAIANALGSGLVESSAFMPFLPGLSQLLLGEPLRMPSVATWWCGQQGPLQFVLDHLQDLVVKPMVQRPGRKVEFPSTMSQSELEDLRRRIEADPGDYVAQEQVSLSTAPTRTDEGSIAPRHVVLRVFAAWNGSGYNVMPGGLTRVSTDAQSLNVSMQLGGGSKDTWVLGGSEVFRGVAALPQAVAPAAGATHLPSRAADNFFWLGRYTERVEAGVRLVRALLPGLSGEEDFGGTASLETIIHLLEGLGYLSEEFHTMSIAQQRWHIERLFTNLVYDPSRSAGIGWNLNSVRRVSWPLKERLSADTWRVLQQLETDFSAPVPVNPEHRLAAQLTLLDRVIITLSSFAGLMAENATRGDGWRFLRIGKRLERALQTTDLLLATFANAPFDLDPCLRTLLQIADSSMTYRSRYFTTYRTEYVLELLLADETNPRSVGFQLRGLVNHLRQLPGYDRPEERPLPLELAESVLRQVRSASCEDLAAPDAEGNLPAFADLARRIKGHLHDLSDALSARHFSHLVTSRLNPSY